MPLLIQVLTLPEVGVVHTPPRAMSVPPVTVRLPSVSTLPAMPPIAAPPRRRTKPPDIVKLPLLSTASVSPAGVTTSR